MSHFVPKVISKPGMKGPRDPLLMEKLGSANKIRSSELECDLLGKMNNFIFPSFFFYTFELLFISTGTQEVLNVLIAYPCCRHQRAYLSGNYLLTVLVMRMLMIIIIIG